MLIPVYIAQRIAGGGGEGVPSIRSATDEPNDAVVTAMEGAEP